MSDVNLQITARGPRVEAEAAAAAIDVDPILEGATYAILEEDEARRRRPWSSACRRRCGDGRGRAVLAVRCLVHSALGQRPSSPGGLTRLVCWI